MGKQYDISSQGASDKGLPPSMRSSQTRGAEIMVVSGNPLDSPEYQERFKRLLQWRRQARVAQAENRTQMAIDEDFYDGIQMDPEDLQILIDRGQAPLIFNVVKNTLNWILGTERKSRIDWRVLPRKKSGAGEAKTKTKLIKYVADVNKAEYSRSRAFTEAACAGMGWLEYGAKNTDEILFIRDERWRNMWFDHLDMSLDCSGSRFVIREKWLDLDIALAMFEGRESELKVLAEGVNSLYPYHPDDTVITDNASEFDLENEIDGMFGGPFDGNRERVKLVEMEYRMPQRVKIMRMRDDDTPFGALNGAIYKPGNDDHDYLVKGGYFTLTDARKLVVRRAMWAGRTLLQDDMTPYQHNRFSFVPIFCYRRKRDGMPYGIIRDLRDPQSDLNKRRSKSLFLLSANQIVMEKGATDDIVDFHSEMQKPDGIGIVNDGAMEKWKQIPHDVDVGEHAQIAQDDERFIHSISGVTPDSEWQKRKDLSGKAMSIQENQALVSHGVIFDNFYFSLQAGGEITLSNIEQFFDQEKEVRITGDQQKDEFIEINKYLPDGTVDNSITAAKADFIIGKQDYRETIRQAMVDQLMQLVTNLGQVDPRVALNLLDLVVELMDDLPNKDEAVARIRKINGQNAPEDDMTPEQRIQAQQAEQAAAQEAQQMKQLQQALLEIKLAEGQSKAAKDLADASIKKLEGFLKALEAAGSVAMAPELVQAADQLIAESQGIGESQNNGMGG